MQSQERRKPDENYGELIHEATILARVPHFERNRLSSVVTRGAAGRIMRKTPAGDFESNRDFRQLTHSPGRRQTLVIRISWAAESSSVQAVEEEIDRNNATVPGDDKIGSRVSRWFTGSAGYPSNPSRIT